eukprot:jgi/Hompol1/3268/HPOL_003175-RA
MLVHAAIRNLVLATGVAASTAISTSAGAMPYSEQLSLTQFADGKVLAEFRFTSILAADVVEQGRHFDLLPRSIGEVFRANDVREMHLTMTQGRWSYDRWGHSTATAPTGLELWTWFDSADVDAKWKGLTNALAGLFCASLNFLDQSVTSVPLLSFDPEGILQLNSTNANDVRRNEPAGFQIRYGSLPREASGLATLLNAYKVFDGNFQSIGVHLRPVQSKSNGRVATYEFLQTFTVVLDPIRTEGRKDWSLSSLFGRTIPRTCPYSSSTAIDVSFPGATESSLQIFPAHGTDLSDANGLRWVFNVGNDPSDIHAVWANGSINKRNPNLAHVRTHRHMRGVGQERGSIVVDFYNSLDTSVPATYFESIPWILK